jgi:hypothetical protein
MKTIDLKFIIWFRFYPKAASLTFIFFDFIHVHIFICPFHLDQTIFVFNQQSFSAIATLFIFILILLISGDY